MSVPDGGAMHLVPLCVDSKIRLSSAVKSPVTISLFVRIAFFVYGLLHDKYAAFKYTDIDYIVITDGARLVCRGESPYASTGYRYPPLLALSLTPSCLSFHFGKILFILADVLVVYLMQVVVKSIGAPEEIKANNLCYIWWLWVVNPFVVIISTRGSFDSISNALILGALYLGIKRSSLYCGIILGCSIYLRIYPIIYLPAMLLYLSDLNIENLKCLLWGNSKKWDSILDMKSPLIFLIACTASCALLAGVSYCMYGSQYIEESVLYHASRLDYRHNFSVHFLWIYLMRGDGIELSRELVWYISTLPQVILIVASSLSLALRNITLCLLVCTMVFVTFNKVCTAQYFTWYAIFVPILFETGVLKPSKSIIIAMTIWIVALLLWLLCAYSLEFRGINYFLELWMCCLLFQAANVYVILQIIDLCVVSKGHAGGTLKKEE